MCQNYVIRDFVIVGEGISPSSAFVIGSCSKTVTALATLIAMSEAGISVDTQLIEVLPVAIWCGLLWWTEISLFQFLTLEPDLAWTFLVLTAVGIVSGCLKKLKTNEATAARVSSPRLSL